MAGPFYFAWVADGDVEFSSADHLVEDERVYALEVQQHEGDHATLHIDVRNPKVGLLGSERYRWMILSWDPVGLGQAADVVPLFKGRVLGVESEIDGELVRLEFLARADDFEDRKADLADTLKVRPRYDPVWVEQATGDTASTITNVDSVLEGYSALWHIDRVTLEVTTSDVIEGEDGTVEFTEADVLYDGVSVTYAGKPVNKIKGTGTVSWTQEGEGSIDLTKTLVQAFKAAGSPYKYPLISSLTGEGLLSSWPKDGASIGEGWTVDGSSAVKATVNVSKTSTFATTWATANGWVQPYVFKVTYYAQNFDGIDTTKPSARLLATWVKYHVEFDVIVLNVTFGASYRASRKRSEVVKFTLEADLQEIDNDLSLEATEDTLDLSSEYVGKVVDDFELTTTVTLTADSTTATLASSLDLVPGKVYDIVGTNIPLLTTFTAPDGAGSDDEIDIELSQAATDDSGEGGDNVTLTPDGVLPIGDLKRNSYFLTDRGQESFEYLLYVARARMLAKARCVEVSFSAKDWSIAHTLSLRNSAKLFDDRLPGGQAIGKVTDLSLSFKDGQYQAEITMKCACGKGSSLDATVDGEGVYADEGYMDLGYQMMIGGTVNLEVGDIQYETFTDVVDDDGLDLFNVTEENALVSLTVTDGMFDQTDIAYAAGAKSKGGAGASGLYSDPVSAIRLHPTTVDVKLVSMTGEFKTTLEPEVSKLMIPRSIDLEAA